MSSPAANSPAAGQTIPPIPPSSNQSKDAEKAFPLAAIVCVAIVGGFVAIFVVYRLYRCIYARRQLRASYNEPPSPQSANPLMPPGPYMSQVAYTNYHPSVYARMPSLYSDSTFGGMDGGKSDMNLALPSNSSRTLAGSTGVHKINDSQSSIFNTQTRTESMSSVPGQGGLIPVREGSGSGSSGESWPSTPHTAAFTDGPSRSVTSLGGLTSPVAAYNGGTHSRPGVRGDSSMSTDRLRAQGSRSSMLFPNNQQAYPARDRRSLAHAYSSSSVSVTSQQSFGGSQGYLAPTPRQHRLPGPPHARHSRVEIVPPMPLAPPPGSVVATDKATLAFSPLSGIGSGTALFASNLHLASLTDEPTRREGNGARQHRQQATGQTVQTSSSNTSGDDVSSPWYSTPLGTSEELARPMSKREVSSNGSRGTLDSPSEEAEDTSSPDTSEAKGNQRSWLLQPGINSHAHTT